MIRDITIKAVLNGFIVNVGCQQVVFATRTELLGSLEEYLLDPEGTERSWREKALNAKHTLASVCNEVTASPPQNLRELQLAAREMRDSAQSCGQSVQRF